MEVLSLTQSILLYIQWEIFLTLVFLVDKCYVIVDRKKLLPVKISIDKKLFHSNTSNWRRDVILRLKT